MISFEDVSFSYTAGEPIFQNVSFQLAVGKTTAVMGRSGSGKTTLLKLACGLLAPDGGRVSVGDKAVGLGVVRGLVFHEDTLLPWLTVADNVAFAGQKKKASSRYARTLLSEFGLQGELAAYPHQLSAGMRKRAEFARALIADDSLLLLDEPFVSLDDETRAQFWGLWRDSDHIRARTKMIITHDADEVQAIADNVILLEYGRPVAVRLITGKDMDNFIPAAHRHPRRDHETGA